VRKTRKRPFRDEGAVPDTRHDRKEEDVRIIAAVGVVVLLASGVAAHHSFDAEYDSKKPITITGFVTKLDWINPHAYVYVDVRDDAGAVTNYKVEMGPPYALTRGGWKRETVKIGDKVTINNAALAKDGRNAAGSMPTTSMTLADGQKLVMR
jgi:hypothetical protein